MFSGIPQIYTIDIYGLYFEKYMLGYLIGKFTRVAYTSR